MLVKPLNKLCVVATRVITHKTVDLAGYFVVIEDSAYNRCLGGPSIVSIEVSKSDNSVLLFVIDI